MADKGAILQGAQERNFMNILSNVLGRLFVDSTQRLAVTLSGSNTLTTVTTVTTMTNLTNWGVTPAQAYSQVESANAYNNGPRRNLIVS